MIKFKSMRYAAALILGVIVLSGCAPKLVGWEEYTPEVMKEALSSGQPVIAYFHAAWCPPCYKLKDKTFTNPSVMQALEPFRKISVDMSYNHSERIEAVAREFQIESFPTVLFFDQQGNRVEPLTIHGYISPENFLKHIQPFTAVLAPEPGKA